MNTKKIAQYIGILIILAITAVSAFTRPSPAPNNNNVYPFIDSVALQEVKKESLSVDHFLVEQAARFDGKVFIDKFISGPTPAASDVYVGSGGTKSRLLAQGNVTAGEYLQADNLINGEMKRVCRDSEGFLILCGSNPEQKDECPNIEGIQITLQTDLFVKEGANCVKPGTTVVTPPPPAPVVATIEVRYIPVQKDKQFTFLSFTTESFLRSVVWTELAPIYRITFDKPLDKAVTFSTGFCTKHAGTSYNILCKGVPLTFQNYLAAPDTEMGAYPNALVNPYWWSGQEPTCSATAQWTGCNRSLRGPIPTDTFGRSEITLPIGTMDSGWRLHTYTKATTEQQWNPRGAPQPIRSYLSQYYVTVPNFGNYSNMNIDNMNFYLFNISDTQIMNPTKFQNLTNPKYKVIWNTTEKF